MIYRQTQVALVASLLALTAQGRDVPANVQSFYNSIKSKACSNKLATGFYSQDSGSADYSYCGDHLADSGVIYIKGPGSQFTNMDIDCDGEQGGAGSSDGRCKASTDTQSQTSFKDTVAGYHKGVSDLNANVHMYVVFGNDGSKSGWKKFDPQAHGVEPLSVMAVVCGDKLFYGIWGDTNGDDGDKPMVGEASISMGTACFGNDVNGNAGHDENDVLYLAFTGKNAVPGTKADWGAKSWSAFESSIAGIGDELIAKLGGGSGASASNSSTPVSAAGNEAAGTGVAETGAAEPTTTGHRGGHGGKATTSAHGASPTAAEATGTAVEESSAVETGSTGSDCTDPDCADTTSTDTGAAATGTGVAQAEHTGTSSGSGSCDWAGHCEGAKCSSDDDCSGELSCSSGKCKA